MMTEKILYTCFDKNMEERLFHMHQTAERHTIGEISEWVPSQIINAEEEQLSALDILQKSC